jgi:hypothetical protein
MTIDDYIEQRNALYLKAENISKEAADTVWAELGVANRHIDRVLRGKLFTLPQVEKEIQDCLQRVRDLPAWRNWQPRVP